MKYLRKINENRAPAGLERVLLRIAPLAALLCVVVPAAVAFGARAWFGADALKTISRVDIAAIAVSITGLTVVFTVAIGAIIVFIMKGPGYVADAYEVNDASVPASVGETKQDLQRRRER